MPMKLYVNKMKVRVMLVTVLAMLQAFHL